MEFLQITANTQAREVKFEGQDYLVVPMTMITPGVLNGSNGPLLYTEDELAKNPAAWNGMTIVVNHP